MKSSEADLDPSAGVKALGTVQAAYERWAGANGHLPEQISKAAAQRRVRPSRRSARTLTPQIDVTRAAIRFARVCPAEGPDLGLLGALLCWPRIRL